METISSERLNRNSSAVRLALETSDEVELTHRGKPYGLAIAHARAIEEREERDRLRREVARLRQLLDGHPDIGEPGQSLASAATS